MLTIKQLRDMPADTVFARGSFRDSNQEVNVLGTGKILRWIAVRGHIGDWCIYYHTSEKTWDEIQKEGDKLMFDRHIRRLVPCDKDALAMYRR